MIVANNADTDKHSYSGHGTGFDSRSHFLNSNFDFGKNIIVFGVANSSSTHTDYRKRDILVLGEGSTQGLDNVAIITEAKYFINFTKQKRNLSSYSNGSNSFLYVNGVKYIN